MHERTRCLRLNVRHSRCLTNQLTSTAILPRMTTICAVSRQYNSQSPPGSDAVDKTIPSNRPSRRNNRGDSIHPRNDTATASEVVKRGGNSRRPVGKLPLKRSTEPIARTRDTSTINASAKPPRRTNVDPIVNRYAAPIIGRGRSSKILAAKKSTSTTKGTTKNRQVGLFVTRLATKTRAADVAAHVSLETGLTVKCEPIKTKYDGYLSFFVS